ncbi:hypothetical protein CANTEDRAFT_112252, partial [Yamadazyma tenuis ATCC 10573]
EQLFHLFSPHPSKHGPSSSERLKQKELPDHVYNRCSDDALQWRGTRTSTPKLPNSQSRSK